MSETFQTMYLKTVESSPSKIPKVYPSKSFGNYRTNKLDVSDIDGAQSMKSFSNRSNRNNFYNVDDIDMARPKRNIPTKINRLNHQYNRHLRNDDVELSKPKLTEMVTNRVTDPLNPNYKLPSYKKIPITPPKFIRPTNYLKDIEGATLDNYNFRKNKNKKSKDILNKYQNVVDKQSAYGIKPRKNIGSIIYDNDKDNFYQKRYIYSPSNDVLKSKISTQKTTTPSSSSPKQKQSRFKNGSNSIKSNTINLTQKKKISTTFY